MRNATDAASLQLLPLTALRRIAHSLDSAKAVLRLAQAHPRLAASRQDMLNALAPARRRALLEMVVRRNCCISEADARALLRGIEQIVIASPYIDKVRCVHCALALFSLCFIGGSSMSRVSHVTTRSRGLFHPYSIIAPWPFFSLTLSTSQFTV